MGLRSSDSWPTMVSRLSVPAYAVITRKVRHMTTLPVIIRTVVAVADTIAATDKRPIRHTGSAPIHASITRIVAIDEDTAFPILIVSATSIDARLTTVTKNVDIAPAAISSAATLRGSGH